MFPREVDSPFSRRSSKKVTQPYKRPRAARPFVFKPALCRTVFEVFPKAIKDRIKLFQRGSDAFAFFQIRDSFRFTGPGVSHQDPASRGLTPRRLPDLDGATRECKPIKSPLFPEAFFRLQVNTRDRIVTGVFDYLQLPR